MTEDEKVAFEKFIVSRVNAILGEQDKRNNEYRCQLNNDVKVSIIESLPDIKKAATPERDWIYVFVQNAINGAFVGLAIVIAKLFI